MKMHNRVSLLLAGVIAAAAAILVAPTVSYAQSSDDGQAAQALPTPAPAMHLKDVRAIPGVPKLTVTNAQGHWAHVMPTVGVAAARQRALDAIGFSDTGPLVYHAGGSVMTGNLLFYVIFWVPPTLQTGAATSMSNGYKGVMLNLAKGYGGHSLSAINTQYYQTISAVTTYVSGNGSYAGTYTDTSAYPASGCSYTFSTVAPGNCLTDAQIQAEITKVMGIKGWTGGQNKIFLLFTSKNEGSCFDNTNASCAYRDYCAYHSSFSTGSGPVIYGNEPYGNNSWCKGSQNSPNSAASPDADAASTSASHEMSEAITDPYGNAWYSASGNENGDLCAYNYGTRTYDSAKANQSWNGKFFDLQQEYSNHQKAVSAGTGCIQHGP